MLRCLYTSATGMDAQQLRMDTIANNLANVSTTGFKRSNAQFEDLLSETLRGAGAPDPRGGTAPAPLQVGLGVRPAGTPRSFSQGDLVSTSNPLDIAIQGSGFFRIQRVSGDYAYTRAGNFRVDATGRMVTQEGELVDPAITVPSDATQITIAIDGTISVLRAGQSAPTTIGQLELSTFPNPGGLSALGNNLFQETAASGQALQYRPGDQGTGTLSQGYLESSNVQAVQEMIDMISTQRAYELNSKVIQTADQMLQRITTIR
jgi:flagellar basal-body rod protein FlgG